MPKKVTKKKRAPKLSPLDIPASAVEQFVRQSYADNDLIALVRVLPGLTLQQVKAIAHGHLEVTGTTNDGLFMRPVPDKERKAKIADESKTGFGWSEIDPAWKSWDVRGRL